MLYLQLVGPDHVVKVVKAVKVVKVFTVVKVVKVGKAVKVLVLFLPLTTSAPHVHIKVLDKPVTQYQNTLCMFLCKKKKLSQFV